METNVQSVFPSNCYHLIGDSGFQLSPSLLVPYKDYGNLTDVMTRYNSKISQTRYLIENSFGLLKGRFRRLKYVDADVSQISSIIIACCVLHNITLGQANEEAMLLDEGYAFRPLQNENVGEAINLPAELGGTEKREFVSTLL